jgi:hypothetical protein
MGQKTEMTQESMASHETVNNKTLKENQTKQEKEYS